MDHRHGRPQLSLVDAVSIIVGIVIGTAIFKTPPLVFEAVSSPAIGVLVWIAGALLALIGALCYAELASTYPYCGGDYDYQRRAFGPFAGFLFGWAHLVVVITASIAQMAYVFADYLGSLVPISEAGKGGVAVLVVASVTIANRLGLHWGKNLQNILAAAKVGGLGLVIACGLAIGLGLLGDPPRAASSSGAVPGGEPALGLALIFVLYAYGGWNDAAFVAAEVENPKTNLPRALVGGLALIAVLYVLANLAYLAGLGWDGARTSPAPAADLGRLAAGTVGQALVGFLVMLSALGAVNGMVLTGARVYVRLGDDHRLFGWLAVWDPRRHCPPRSLMAQALVACGMIAVVGTRTGQTSLDRIGQRLGLEPIPWHDGGFAVLVRGTAPVFWFFFLLTGIALIVLRWRDPDTPRPFRVPLFPATPLVFCATCAYMLHASARYAGSLLLLGTIPLLPALGLWPLGKKTASPPGAC